MGTQKNRLSETILLSTHNIGLALILREIVWGKRAEYPSLSGRYGNTPVYVLTWIVLVYQLMNSLQRNITINTFVIGIHESFAITFLVKTNKHVVKYIKCAASGDFGALLNQRYEENSGQSVHTHRLTRVLTVRLTLNGPICIFWRNDRRVWPQIVIR